MHQTQDITAKIGQIAPCVGAPKSEGTAHMFRSTRVAASGALIIALATPALADKPSDPHERRDLVQMNQDVQQSANGPSGFGKRISYRSTTKSDDDKFKNFGDYLKQMTGG